MFNWNDYQKSIEEILDLRLDELRAEIVERITFAFDEIPHYFFQNEFEECVARAYADGYNDGINNIAKNDNFAVGDVVKIDEDTLAIVTDPTNEHLTVMTCEGQFWNVDPNHVEKTRRYVELGVALDSLAYMQSELRTKGE